MTGIIAIVAIAFLCEAVWETLKMIWQDGKFSVDRLGAIIISVFVALIAGLDLFVLIGIPLAIPVVGFILTGLLISRGSNFVHDLYKKLVS